MRVTFLSASLDLAGGSRIIATYSKMLADHGHQVTVVAPKRRTVPLRRRLREFVTHGRWEPGRGDRSHFDNLGLDIRLLDHRQITEADVPDADVIIGTWWETTEWANAFSSRKGAKVYFVQGHEVFENLPIDRVRATYHMPFQKIVVSGWLKRVMEQTYGDFNTVLVPNCVDHAVFHAEPRGKQPVPTIGFMYAPGGVKGSEIAIEAIQSLRQRIPNLRVVSFGVQSPKGVKGLGSDFRFTRLPDGEQLRQSYAACDVWLCSSRSEGFGLPAMEAMACRTPLVSTRVGWPLDAVQDGVNGLLVPIDDPAALGEAALKVLTLDGVAWKAMSEQAWQAARRYQWKTSYEMFVAALETAVASKAPSPSTATA